MTDSGSTNPVLTEIADGVASVTLNRPEKMNALSGELADCLVKTLDELEQDDTVRVVVISGAGRCFSAGFDLAFDDDSSSWGVEEWTHESARDLAFLRRVWSFRKPTIAQVHGFCLGGACELAMLCDITIVSEETRLGEPEIRFSTNSPALIMPWLVPMKVARELLLTGKMISARRALDIGMVNHVVPLEHLSERVEREARLLTKIAPFAAQVVKQSLNQTYEAMGLTAALSYGSSMFAMLAGTPTEEFQEFERLRIEKGTRAALSWRDAHFAGLDDDR